MLVAEDMRGQHAEDRDLSSRSSLDNIEALMNRYRKGRPQSRTSQRSDQEAVQHAVSILRAAGMQVCGGGHLSRNQLPGKEIVTRQLARLSGILLCHSKVKPVAYARVFFDICIHICHQCR